MVVAQFLEIQRKMFSGTSDSTLPKLKSFLFLPVWIHHLPSGLHLLPQSPGSRWSLDPNSFASKISFSSLFISVLRL